MAGVPGDGLTRGWDHRCHLCPDSCVAHVATQDMARPEGLEHSLPTIHIEGVAELVEVLRAA